MIDKRKLLKAVAFNTAAVVLGAEAISNYIIYTSVVMPEKDKNTFPPDGLYEDL